MHIYIYFFPYVNIMYTSILTLHYKYSGLSIFLIFLSDDWAYYLIDFLCSQLYYFSDFTPAMQ